jgi:hypothetical protein
MRSASLASIALARKILKEKECWSTVEEWIVEGSPQTSRRQSHAMVEFFLFCFGQYKPLVFLRRWSFLNRKMTMAIVYLTP